MKFATKLIWHYTHFTLGMLLHYLGKLKIQIFCRYSADMADMWTNCMTRAFQRYVWRTEMLSSFRIRIGNISPSATRWHFPLWKWGTKTPNLPFPLHDVDPYLIHQCLGPPHASPPSCSSDSWGTVAHRRRKVPIGYNGAPQIRPQKYPFPRTDPQTHYLSHPWTRPTCDAKRHPDSIRRFSTVHWTDRQIVHGKVWSMQATAWATRPKDGVLDQYDKV